MARFTVYKQPFEFADRYAAGPVELSANEAAVLNQQMGELISHRLRAGAFGEVKAGIDPTSEQIAQAQADFAEYLTTFEFGAARAAVAREPIDPVGKEAKRMAVEALRAKLKAAGMVVLKKDVAATSDKEYTAERFAAKVAEIAGMEATIAAAKKIVAQRAKATDAGEGFEL